MIYRAVLLTLFVARVAGAASSPAGPGEFEVSAAKPDGQVGAFLAPTPDGGFAAGFTALSPSGGFDPDGFIRLFDADGVPTTSDITANMYTPGTQGVRGVVAAPSGTITAVIESTEQDGSGPGIFFRRFDPSGVPLGADVQVNQFTTGSQSFPVIAASADGAFIVAWHSFGQDGSQVGVYARRYDTNGSPKGAEFRVNDFTPGDQADPSIAIGPSGESVIAWTDYDARDGDQHGVYARRFDQTGAALGTDFQVNVNTVGIQAYPAVVMDDFGHFVVVWQETRGPDIYVMARGYDAVTGAALTPEIELVSAGGIRTRPRIAADSSGRFLVSYLLATGPTTVVIMARRFANDGTPLGDEFQVSFRPVTIFDFGFVHLHTPAIFARDVDSDFAIAWMSGQSPKQSIEPYRVLARRLVPTQPISGRKLSIADNADATKRKIVFLSKDTHILAMPVFGLDPTSNGASLQLFNDNGSGESVCIDLPAGGWTAGGAGLTRTYKDSTGSLGPCTAARLKSGKLFKITCSAKTQPIGFSLDEPSQVRIGIRISSGPQTYCALFGGAVKKDSPLSMGGKFLAVNAAAPASCPTPPSSCP